MRYHFLMAVYVTNFCNVHKSDVWTLDIYSAGPSEQGRRQILARIEENLPDSNGLRLRIPPHPTRILRPSYGPVSLYMPRAMRTLFMSYIWCVSCTYICTRIVIHAKSIQVFLLPQCKFKTVLWFHIFHIYLCTFRS